MEDKYKDLYRFHLVIGFLHLIQGVLLIVPGNENPYPMIAIFLRPTPETRKLVPDPRLFRELPFGAAAAIFRLISDAGHSQSAANAAPALLGARGIPSAFIPASSAHGPVGGYPGSSDSGASGFRGLLDFRGRLECMRLERTRQKKTERPAQGGARENLQKPKVQSVFRVSGLLTLGTR